MMQAFLVLLQVSDYEYLCSFIWFGHEAGIRVRFRISSGCNAVNKLVVKLYTEMNVKNRQDNILKRAEN